LPIKLENFGKMHINIDKKDFVLEVGSGHRPCSRSNILCDKFFLENKERSLNKLKFDRPLVIADGARLPFKDKTFDFVICRQVIEHTKNPKIFFKEQQRVGQKGLITCPNAQREYIFGWKYHRWWIRSKKNKLIFRKKKKINNNNFFHMLYKHKLFFQRFCSRHDELLNIYFYWNQNSKVEIKDIAGQEFLKGVKQDADNLLNKIEFDSFLDFIYFLQKNTNRVVKKVEKTTRLLFWNTRRSVGKNINLQLLRKYIVCPNCQGKLKFKRSFYKCTNCGKKYKINNGIPIFLLN